MHTIVYALVGVLALLISLSVHEYCHALAGFVLGDETAKRMGRLTLNPIAHIDPIGTILVPLLGMISGLPVFGWAKPVPFNPYNLKYPKWGPIIVALAGPISNFFSAFLYVLLLKLCLGPLNLPPNNLLVTFLVILIIVNIVLGLFNFIPVPPLDGSRILTSLLDSPRHRNTLMFLETKGPMILLIIVILDAYLPFSPLNSTFNFVINGVFSLAGLGRLF